MSERQPSSGDQPSTTIEQALELIEERLFEPLSLANIASMVGLSSFHFARLFAAVTGDSPIAHLRRRRLEVAAERLAADPGLRLVDLALDSGFESQEAFTRAFTRAFGIPPGRYRRTRGNIRSFRGVNRTTMATRHVNIVMESVLRPRSAFAVAGLSGVFDKNSVSQIPQLWERFRAHPLLGMKPGQPTYGVCWSTSPEEPFQYLAGVEIAADSAAPGGLELRTVPAQTYLVFRQELSAGPLHPQIGAAMQEIWGKHIAQSGQRPSGGADFEYYPSDFRPGSAGMISYWIPVEA